MKKRTGWFLGVVCSVTMSLGVSGVAQAEQLPAGADLLDSLVVNVSDNGLNFMEAQIPGVVPDQLNVPDMSGELFSCFLDTNDYAIKNIVVYVTVNDVQLTPTDGALDVYLDADISADARLETSGCLFNNGCQVHIDPSQVTAASSISFATVVPQTGRPAIDAIVPNFDVTLNINDVNISQCTLGSFLEFFVNLFIGTVEDAVVGAIQDQIAGEIEPLIEDALNSLQINQTVDLLDAQITLELFPSDIVIDPAGMSIMMGSNVTAPEVAKCAKGGPGGSLLTPSDLPAYNGMSPGGMSYHAAASISDDFANQTLFAAWEAGLLCMELSEIGDGEPLTTDLLSLLGGEVTRVVTPGGALVVKLTAPGGPPVAEIAGAGANVAIDDLHIDMIADVHERMSRLVELTVSPEIAAEIQVNTTPAGTTEIVPLIEFDTSNLGAEIVYNELLPETGEVILTLLPTMLQSFLPSLDIPPIELPELAGITLDSTEVTEDGPSADFLSVYTGLGGQLDLAGGCAGGGTGCAFDGGCTVSGSSRSPLSAAFAPLALLCALGWVVVRRRREE